MVHELFPRWENLASNGFRVRENKNKIKNQYVNKIVNKIVGGEIDITCRGR